MKTIDKNVFVVVDGGNGYITTYEEAMKMFGNPIVKRIHLSPVGDADAYHKVADVLKENGYDAFASIGHCDSNIAAEVDGKIVAKVFEAVKANKQ